VLYSLDALLTLHSECNMTRIHTCDIDLTWLESSREVDNDLVDSHALGCD
jgi:hypothetical protein